MNFLDGYINAGKRIKNTQARHEFYGAIIDYYESETGEVPTFEHEIAEVAFWAVKYSLDKARNGRSGGQAKAEANQQATPQAKAEAKPKQTTKQSPSKPPTKEEEEEKEEFKETTPNGVVKKNSRFSPPTPEEVQAYAQERGGNIDAQRFVDFYASKGWKVGTSPMKDWKAAVRNWIARDNPTSKPKTEKEVKLDETLRKYDEYSRKNGYTYDADTGLLVANG